MPPDLEVLKGRGQRDTWIITTLAEYQTAFWIEICKSLTQAGQKVFVLSFDDRSTEMLMRAGIPCADVFAVGKKLTEGIDIATTFDAMMTTYGIDNPNLMLSHERRVFNIRASLELKRKYVIYARGVEDVAERLALDGREMKFVQELGGFLSVLAALHVARRRGIDNWFIEPSFFRGRLFFNRNSLAALVVPGRNENVVTDIVRRYLEDTLREREIVVPIKDRSHYNTAFKKIFNWHNFRRLRQKAVDKYILGKHQDFGYVGNHVRTHIRAWRNSAALRDHYTPLPHADEFVYFPLHVPADVALTLRSPAYLDQLAVVDYLLRNVPPQYKLAIKEHPAQIGAIDYRGITALLQRYDNLVLLPPSTNNFRVIERAAAVVSVNSKSGAEAMLLGKPVVVLGDAFYTAAPFVTRCESLGDSAEALRVALRKPAAPFSDVAGYFQAVFERTLPGELYVGDAENVRVFTSSLTVALTASGRSVDYSPERVSKQTGHDDELRGAQ